MNLEAYLERIRYSGTMDATLSTLRRLHRAHMLTIPFENLDIHLKRPIRLDEESLFDKLVNQKRGGFCYEQNGLFAAVLREMGFKVSLLEARVKTSDGSFGIPFDHLLLMVELDERWLADVGFGDSFLEPIRLDDPADQIQDDKGFRVVHDGRVGIHSVRGEDGEWRDEHQFFLAPRQLSDFQGACSHHQTSPDSPFTQRRVCSLAREDGRITLRDDRLIVTKNGQRQETSIKDEAAFHAALEEYFGMVLSPQNT